MQQVTKNLFENIQAMLPGLPERITRIELVLTMDMPPLVRCEFLVKDVAGVIKDEFKVFEIVERDTKRAVEMVLPESVTKVLL